MMSGEHGVTGPTFDVVLVIMAGTLVVLGLTATTGMRWYARRTGSGVPDGNSSTLPRPLP